MCINTRQALIPLVQSVRVALLLSIILCVSGGCFRANAWQVATAAPSPDRDRGIQLYNQGDATGAITQLRAALQKDKADPKSWYYLGLSLTRDGQYKEASKAFEAATKLQPNWATAHAGLAFTLLLRNKLTEALSAADHALALDPGSADAHYAIGVIRLRQGDNSKALESAETVLRLDPGFAKAYLLKSQSLVSFFQGTELHPNDEPTEKQLVRYKAAAESLEKYLKLSAGTKSDATWREQLEALQYSIGMLEKTGTGRTVFTGREVTTKARILSKPEPSYTGQAQKNGVTGTVILRAIFAADGQVKHVMVVRGLPDGLTEESIAAARRIKFVPAMIDGKPVSMFVQMEYNFLF